MTDREFISAKDLPVSESDSVDVLCVDNGELKLKAGANLGGSNSCDLVVNYLVDDVSGSAEVELKSGDFEIAKEKILNGLLCTIFIYGKMTDSENRTYNSCAITYGVYFNEDDAIFINDLYTGINLRLLSDNTVTIE